MHEETETAPSDTVEQRARAILDRSKKLYRDMSNAVNALSATSRGMEFIGENSDRLIMINRVVKGGVCALRDVLNESGNVSDEDAANGYVTYDQFLRDSESLLKEARKLL